MPDLSVFNPSQVSRRRFLQGSAMAASALAAGPYISRLSAFAAPPVADNQGILITILLSGGNDGLNMVAPVGSPAYMTLRPTIGITNGLSVGNGLALHPSLTKLKTRFDQGHVAVVSGVGYQPPDLSHFSSSDIWMHGWGGGGVPTTGWLGRYLDTLPNTDHESLYGVGLHGGLNPHLAGSISQASSLPLDIGSAFGVDRSDPSDARMFDTLIAMGAGSSGLGALGDLYDTTEMDLLQLAQRINPAYGFAQQPTDIAQQLVLAAHLINANLGIRVVDTALDGFDTHSDQPDWHATLMTRLDDAIDAFYLALDPRWRPQVTLMTFSEFGRRPEENGDAGTDHGSAAPLFVIGDNVNGGLHGAQPSLTALDGDGNLVPAVDFRAVYASVLSTWLNADAGGLLGSSFSGVSLFKRGPGVPVAVPPAGGGAVGPTSGYWLAGPKGAVHGVGTGIKFGSVAHVAKPIVAGAATPTHHGLWLTTAAGGIFCFGDAKPRGSMAGKGLKKPIVAMAATPSGNGYWMANAAGAVFCFGDARSHGNAANRHLAKPVVGMAATPSGKGYWLVTAAGAVLCFGDARPHGNTAAKKLEKPIVDICATPTGKGYWLVTAGGGVFAFGDAHVHGSKVHTSAPVVTIARTPSGKGYWLAASDGTVAPFGDAAKLEKVKAPTATLVRCQ